MRNRLRLLVVGATATLAATMAVAVVDVPAASAAGTGTTTGVPAPYVTTANASDPDAKPCYFNTQFGYCLYTSQDLSGVTTNYGNSYPMNQTLGFFSTDGITWTAEGDQGGHTGVIFQESQYPWVPAGADHLWAPDVQQGSDGNYYLYDPDITTATQAGNHTSSRVGVSVSSGPFGPFTYTGTMLSGDPNVNTGYMSDPDAMVGEGGDEYMVYANGDGNNCGGLSVGQLNNPGTSWRSTPTTLTVNGISVLGNCGSTGHPYMEGPQLYFAGNFGTQDASPGSFVLVFAAKPTSTPPGCVTSYGEPNTANEVIAYATSNNPMGPFQYDGILMCGSAQEYTDQASLIGMVSRQDGNDALIMVYHDGAGGTNHNRTVHAECLMYGGGRIAGGMRIGPTGQSGAISQCLASKDVYATALMDNNGASALTTPNGQIVSAIIPGGQLQAKRIVVGPYERYHFYAIPGGSPIPGNWAEYTTGTYGQANWNADANGEFVTSTSSTSPLTANSTSVGSQQNYNLTTTSSGSVRFFASATGKGLATQPSGTLLANSVGSETYTVLHW